jgi:polyisoprenyl-phosphate glycosyltransferase
MLSIVIPAYNEAENLPVLVGRLGRVLSDVNDYEVIIVDDGSSDSTLEVLDRLCDEDARLRYVCLSRNFGHMQALRAGLRVAKGDAVVTMDADLQHPPELIIEMLGRWKAGAHIVNSVRSDPSDTPWFKRWSSRLYYRILSLLSGVEIAPGMADFRLLDRCIVFALRRYKEQDLFWRGIVPSLGYKVDEVHYEAAQRHQGKSKYTLRKMLHLALSGVLTTTNKPLRFATLLALILATISIIYAGYALWVYAVEKEALPGWTSVIIAVSIIGALQLLVLGIMGEYVGQILRETRRRPTYIVRKSRL